VSVFVFEDVAQPFGLYFTRLARENSTLQPLEEAFPLERDQCS